MPYLSTTRLQVHYRTHGDPDGLPMLLLHGSFATSRWWEPLFAELPDAIYAVAPDLRGCGGSEKPSDGYTIEELALDIAAIVEALQWTQFDLIGHAAGGAVAVEYTLGHLAQVSTLTLVDPVPLTGSFTPLEGIMALDQMRSDESLLRQALSLLLPTFDLQQPDHAAFFEQLVQDSQQMAPKAFTAIAESLNHWNRFDAAQTLTLPTLLIWGDQDQLVVREAMTRSLVAIPGANNLDVIRNVGHSPMVEAPLALAERLLEFITEDYAGYEEARAVAAAQAPDIDLGGQE